MPERAPCASRMCSFVQDSDGLHYQVGNEFRRYADVIRYLSLVLLCATAWTQSREAIEAQMKSVARQREAVAKYRAPQALAETAVCERMPEETVVPMIESAARAQQLPAKLVRAVVARESAFR